MYQLGQVVRFTDGQIVTIIAVFMAGYEVLSTTGARFIVREDELRELAKPDL